jgi:type I restriction enzyme M protein
MADLFDSLLDKEDNLLKQFENIHDHIYSHEGLSPQETLEEFVKVIFIKIYDEYSQLNLFNVSEEKNNIDLSNIHHLYELAKLEYSHFFYPHDKIKLSTISLAYIVNKLKSISLIKSSQDAKGLAFQKFLSNHEKSDRGQFFTPEPVIKFCVDIISPNSKDIILDPACGSGGFIVSALQYIKKNDNSLNIKKFINKNLFGVDINSKIARIANMKLLLENNTSNNIFCFNSLDVINIKTKLLNISNFDIILTNPPFGAKITDDSLLKNFNLGYKWIKNSNNNYEKTFSLLNNQTVETLFIEKCLDFLKIGGKMAIVLPNGNFENPSLEYVRSYIIKKAKLLAVVNLPSETFIPYGTGVKTSLLFLERKEENDNNNYNIFFAKVNKLGYLGNKNGSILYKKDKFGDLIYDNNRLPIVDEDFSEISQNYKLFASGNSIISQNCFVLNSKNIEGRFDYDYYSPETRALIINSINKKVKLCDICEIFKTKSKLLKLTDKEVEYIELSDINTNSFEIINSSNYRIHDLPSRASYELLEGDIITAIAGNPVGTRKHATALVTKEYSGCICTNGFRILRNTKIDPYYLLYYMQTDKFLKQMFMYRTGAAIPAVSDNDLTNIIIEIPSDKELKEISDKMKLVFKLRNEANLEYRSIIQKRVNVA